MSDGSDWPIQPWGLRTMWVLAMFDLPTTTPSHRRAYSKFRQELLDDGFSMMQYSVYKRHCASSENAQAHIERMGRIVPEEGVVQFLVVTDNQYGRIATYWGKKRVPAEDPPAQLEMF